MLLLSSYRPNKVRFLAVVCTKLQRHFKIPIMSASHLDKWKESAKTSLNGPLAWLGNKLS